MKVASQSSKTHFKYYDKHSKVEYAELEKNGWIFETFEKEQFVYVGNGLVQRLYSCSEVQLSKVIVQFPLVKILKELKTVRNRQTEIIYGRKHVGMDLRKVTWQKKHK